MATFSLDDRRGFGSAPFEQDPDRQLTGRSSFAKIVHFSFRKHNFGVASNIRGKFTESTVAIKDKQKSNEGYIFDQGSGVIETSIDSISISKNVRSPAGSFSINLFPTENFKKVLRPDDWIMVFLYSKKPNTGIPFGSENCVLLGNIDRVSKVKEKDEETDKVMVRYRVSGKTFGKVFEKTEIWFDPYTNQDDVVEITVQEAGLPVSGSPDQLVENFINIFLKGGGVLATGHRTKPLGQWKIPQALAGMIGSLGGDQFGDILKLNITEGLPGYKDRQAMGVGKNGNLWECIKRSSNSIVNHSFCDLDRDSERRIKPSFTHGVRPYNTIFFNSQFGTELFRLKRALKEKHLTLQELAEEKSLEIAASEILYEDLGFDGHSRFNMIWMEPRGYASELQSMYSNINKKRGVGLPMVVRESIERYGLRRFDQVLDFAHVSETDSKDTNAEYDLFGAFLVQLYDMHYANHLYEQGTIECTGVLEAELGQALIVNDENNKYYKTKVYYVEGYEHEFKFPNTWTTKFAVTRGQFLYGTQVFIDVEADDFGQDDTTLENNYLVKTEVDR